jgi:N4-gp56 family major capsid protein
VIQVNSSLKGKGSGDMVRFGIIFNLGGVATMDNDVLQGNEDKLSEGTMDVTLNMYRKGVRLDSMLYQNYQTWYDMRSEAKSQLKDWFINFFDKQFFEVLTTAPTPKRTLNAATKDISFDLISGVKEMAITPDGSIPKIRPIKINGRDHYALVMHPYCARALKMSAAWKDINELADVRGDSNKLFTGALGMYDNVILYEHENVPIVGGVAQNILMGCQAGVLAEQRDYFWGEDDSFDYKNQIGIMAGCVRGFAKTIFTERTATPPDAATSFTPSNRGGEDYGVITVQTLAAPFDPTALP